MVTFVVMQRPECRFNSRPIQAINQEVEGTVIVLPVIKRLKINIFMSHNSI